MPLLDHRIARVEVRPVHIEPPICHDIDIIEPLHVIDYELVKSKAVGFVGWGLDLGRLASHAGDEVFHLKFFGHMHELGDLRSSRAWVSVFAHHPIRVTFAIDSDYLRMVISVASAVGPRPDSTPAGATDIFWRAVAVDVRMPGPKFKTSGGRRLRSVRKQIV